MKGLLWNVRGEWPEEVINQLFLEEEFKVAIFPECPSNTPEPRGTQRLTSRFNKLALFATEDFELVAEDPARKFAAARAFKYEMTVVGCHLRSKLRGSESDSLAAAMRLRTFVEEVERDLGRETTMVLGDMNMDPFEQGMVHCDGMHAVMSRDIAGRIARTVQSERRLFFYNPMWGVYGDSKGRAPASYYYSSSGAQAYYWHMFDQVLLRPSLVPRLKTVRIIEKTSSFQLIGRNRRPSVFSDHLPVSVEMDGIGLVSGAAQ